MSLRPRRILAVARRDLSFELRGRQGWVLPAVIAALLLPASTVPIPKTDLLEQDRDMVHVSGDVPPAVVALPSTRVVHHAQVRFREQDDGLVVYAPHVPSDMRRALDGPTPAIDVEVLPHGFVFPGRTLLFSLISASTLTGAVSTSIGGERSRKTLVVLLASALSRAEIVVGKWLAWGSVGASTALMAALVSILLGNVSLGAWLLPLPAVPLATVALGLWLVRRAGDVIAGSTVSLRVLPAVLAATGVAAWVLGRVDPHLGALVPLGGALVASGDTWPEFSAVALATAVTLATCVVAMVATAMDLDEVPDRDSGDPRGLWALTLGLLAATTWWVPITAPLLWAEAGNPRLTAELPTSSGVLAGGIGLLAFSLVRSGRSPHPIEVLGLTPRGSWIRAIGLGIAAGILLAVVNAGIGTWSLPHLAQWGSPVADAATRLHAAIQPHGWGLGTLALVIVADEILFRGWLPGLIGHTRSAVVFAMVKAPLDPIGGLLMATILGGVGYRGGVPAAIVARIVWASALVLWWG